MPSFKEQSDLIKIPKKSVREFLAINRLIGKIQLNSAMREEERKMTALDSRFYSLLVVTPDV